MPAAQGLFFEQHGGGAPAPPLLFLHGAGGSRLHWPPALRRMPGRRTLAPDLPGHGSSPADPPLSLERLAERLAAWLGTVEAKPALVVGHSMGSAIALILAVQAPACVAGLVLIGSGPRLRVNPDLLRETADPRRFEGAVEKIVRWSFSAQAPERLVELARRRMIEAGPEMLRQGLAACDAFDPGPALGAIDRPTLLLVGAEDRMTPPALSRELEARIPGAQFDEIGAAGHMLMLERPEIVADRLETFWQRHFAARHPGV